MKNKKSISALIAATVMLTSTVSAINFAEASDTGVMRDITSMELVRDMGVGINLGNTLESCGSWIAEWGAGGYPAGTVEAYETAWGSPIITEKMIKGYASEGFGVVRVPVAWSNLMDENYNIDSRYIARVKQIVDWVIDADMYAIINIHYDSGWMKELPENKEECMKRFETMWKQICENFKDYSDYLMFESQNEELGWESLWNRWSGSTDGKAESYGLVNEVNQLFVDTVRASGGNNDERHLLISGYNTDIELTCDPLFVMPEDPMNRCAVSVHYYTPAGFALLEEDTDWGTASPTWGTEAEFAELEKNMELMKTTYIDKGVPVIIGEYGCPTNNKEPDSVRLFLSSVCEEAYERQMCPVLWDITELHYDRTNARLYDQELRANYNKISGFQYDPSATQPTEPPTEAPTNPDYDEKDVSYKTESYGWVFNANGADAVKFTFKGEAYAVASGVIGWGENWNTVEWEGEFDKDGMLTVTVELPEELYDVQLQKYYAAVWDNSISGMRDIEVELTDLKLLYAKDITDTTEPVTDIMLGDVNGDSKINAFDSVEFRRMLIDGIPNEAIVSGQFAEDTNGDGNITIADLVLLNQFLVGKDVTFKVYNG